ncbi:MAG: ABC transporter ATP-binding protein [Rhodopila sp.]|nr:ABC transporter ATP-binding protein [Rhodopila sp.]
MTEMPSVRVEGASFSYPGGKAGVFDITIDIAPGELVVCIGPSGCGKTTLLKLITGLLPCSAGRVWLGGEDVTTASVRSRQCGIVFQSYALFPHMSVWENVAYPLRVRAVDRTERRRQAEAMLDTVGLRGYSERLPAALSGGQQQRVALARALVFKPRTLLLDEPLSALDAATRISMRDEIRRIQKQQNIASLLITHDRDEALSLADRVAVLRDGRLVQIAPPQELYDRPADAFVASFIGRTNLIDGRVVAPDAVDTAIGRIVTPAHAMPMGAAVRLLVRPERIEPSSTETGENVFAATVVHDRFFGASREIELSVGQGMLKIDTTVRGTIAHVHLPRQAVQFLPTH